jgi:transcriptional regulator with XRE-family HTH domain
MLNHIQRLRNSLDHPEDKAMALQTLTAPTPDDVQHLRQEAGRWLRSLREAAGLSQRELAQAVGFEYYTFISQLEGGRGRLPQGQYMAFAKALNLPLRDFAKTLTRYYDPITYYALFEWEDERDQSTAAAGRGDDIAARLARLEALVANSTR